MRGALKIDHYLPLREKPAPGDFQRIMAKNKFFNNKFNPELAEITGSWGKGVSGDRPGDIQVITFFNNGTYLLYQNGDFEEPHNFGVEYGSYNYDKKSGTLEVEAIIDENRNLGLANPEVGKKGQRYKWIIEGDLSHIEAFDQKLTLKRIGGNSRG